MKNYIIIKNFQHGFGNALFQFFYGKLLSKKYKIELYHPDIPILEIKSNHHLIPENKFKTINLNTLKFRFSNIINYNLLYFRELENYKLYENELNFIRSFYNTNKEKNKEDLVIHLRAGNDWVNINIESVPEPESFKKLLSSLSFKKLYIITNCKKYDTWDLKDMETLQNKLKREGGDGDSNQHYNISHYAWVKDKDKALKKINGILEVFNSYNPIWISKTEKEDFDFICQFDRIILSPSTFSWWAGVLSKSKEIYFYKSWKNKIYISINRKDKCRNLGETNYSGCIQYE